jgi:DNA-binding XRE family transcriptional regulator
MLDGSRGGAREVSQPGFGELLRRYRFVAGLTQEALAEKAGMSARALSDLERGLRQSPHPDTVRRLAEALNLRREDQLALAASAVAVVASGAAEPSTPAAVHLCDRCGSRNSVDARLCVGCGHALPEAARGGSTIAANNRLGRSVAVSVDGEHKVATLLCCQLDNTQLLAEHLGAERLLGFVEHFFQEAEAEVERFEGTISSFLNDGFVALFGAPLAHEDHARRAVLAALGIERRLRDP